MPEELFLAVVKEYRRCVVLAVSLKDGIKEEDIDLEGLKLLITVSSSPRLLCIPKDWVKCLGCEWRLSGNRDEDEQRQRI